MYSLSFLCTPRSSYTHNATIQKQCCYSAITSATDKSASLTFSPFLKVLVSMKLAAFVSSIMAFFFSPSFAVAAW